jgi:hypothetical protein
MNTARPAIPMPASPHPLLRALATALLLPGSAVLAQMPSTAAETPITPVIATAAPSPAAAPAADTVPSCTDLSDQAMAADLRAATAQTQRQDPAQQAQLLDASIRLWAGAAERCEGRPQERARRNLADSQRSRKALDGQLAASPACASSQKDAGTLQEMAQQAVRERRWLDAAVGYRKAETLWDVAAERCSGEAQKLAVQRREQTATDAHNAEFCAPVFERARDQSQQLRRLGGERSSPERLTHSQAAETLWREAMQQCRGAAQDLARSNADNLARERGTPWVITAVPDSPATAMATTTPLAIPAPTRALETPATVSAAAPAPSLPVPAVALAAPTAAAPAVAEPSGLFQGLTNSLSAPRAASVSPAPATGATAAAAAPQEMDLQAGDTRFVGRFAREGNALSGRGQILWANGNRYDGDLVQGRKHGEGSFAWASGQRYSGQWADDQPRGKGQMRFANGDDYEGEVADGLPQGQGRMRYASGDSYDGRFIQGKPEGQGVYRWANGQSYEGPWQGEQPHGHGTLRFANGNIYEGPLVRGTPEGQGRLTYAGGDRYEGQLRQGQPDGQGSYRWTNGDQYTGQWQLGRKHGQGRMQWANGDAWEGRFENDGQTGDGTLLRKGG